MEPRSAGRRVRGICCEVCVPLSAARASEVAALAAVLADPTRLSMLAALRGAEVPVCVCDLTAAFGLSQPTISHHMAKLKLAGLVEARRDGLWTHYGVARPLPPPVVAMLDAAEAASPLQPVPPARVMRAT